MEYCLYQELLIFKLNIRRTAFPQNAGFHFLILYIKEFKIRKAVGVYCLIGLMGSIKKPIQPMRQIKRIKRIRFHSTFHNLQSAFRIQSDSDFSTAKNADCGIITLPTIFILFLPFFCFSSSLRLRVMSPP